MLFCLEKEDCPAGILPQAFSDMPRNWVGNGSPADDEMEGVRDVWPEGEDRDGVGIISSFSSSESSSSPIAKALSSSGTSLSVGVLAPCGARMLSTELFRDVREGLVGKSDDSAASLFRCIMRSISS